MNLLPYDVLMRELREKREGLGLTQRSVAEDAGISPSMLNRMEKRYTDANYRTVYEVWRVINEAQREKQTTAKDLMNRNLIYAHPEETHQTVADRMLENNISQLPVEEDGKIVGHVSEKTLAGNKNHTMTVGELMEDPLITVPSTTSRDVLRSILFDGNPAVIVTEGSDSVGIVTTADLI